MVPAGSGGTVDVGLGDRGAHHPEADSERAVSPSAAAPARRIRLRPGGTTYPVILPSVGDSRLHVAAVVLSIHALGQVVLGFAVSVPQILAAILSCAVLEATIRVVRDRVVAWPASAMLTGSGVALILRDVGTEAGDHWTLRHWWLFALVAGGSLLTKYLLRWRGSHVLNPSNLGLVVAFLVLGSGRVEPLDFWWVPLDGWMILAYGIIVVGGMAITRRGGLAEMAVAFWATLALLLAALALSGHCMATSWSAVPVCDEHFWWVVVTSPETLIFGLLMITDPRTVPAGRWGRVVFGVAVGVASALLMAPRTTEFGAKVGLLGGLLAVCALRPAVAPVLEWRRARAERSPGLRRPVAGGTAVAGTGIGIVVALAAVAAAGAPARSPRTLQAASSSPHPRTIVADVDPARLPAVTIGDNVQEWFGPTLEGSAVGTELLRILDVESLAVRTRDPTLLVSVDHGLRLHRMEERIATLDGDAGPVSEPRSGLDTIPFDAAQSEAIPFDAAQPDAILFDAAHFDTVHLVVIQARGQGDLSLGVEASGTRAVAASDRPGDGVEAFAVTFALRPGGDDRWFLVDVLDP